MLYSSALMICVSSAKERVTPWFSIPYCLSDSSAESTSNKLKTTKKLAVRLKKAFLKSTVWGLIKAYKSSLGIYRTLYL